MDFLKPQTTGPLEPEINLTDSTENSHPQIESLFLEWLAPQIHEQYVDHRWRTAVVVILLVVAGLAIFWQQSFLSAVTFIAIALAASVHFHRVPKHISVIIKPQGIQLGDRLFNYHELDSFWVHYHPGELKELSLRTSDAFHPHIKIPLTDQDPVKIRAHLAQYIPEVPHEDTFTDVLARKLGL